MGEKKPGVDKELIRELAALLKETELSEIEIEQDDFRIRVARAAPSAVAYVESPSAKAPADAQAASEASEAKQLDPSRHPGCVPSPMVGTAYRAADPSAKPFVEIGDVVRAGQTILIVEAMKHMNEVAAPRAGRVADILVEDGQPVEFGQPLMIIE
jgi:acetyl-CoA carboxylase biotin carboxyl carrier protein